MQRSSCSRKTVHALVERHPVGLGQDEERGRHAPGHVEDLRIDQGQNVDQPLADGHQRRRQGGLARPARSAISASVRSAQASYCSARTPASRLSSSVSSTRASASKRESQAHSERSARWLAGRPRGRPVADLLPARVFAIGFERGAFQETLQRLLARYQVDLARRPARGWPAPGRRRAAPVDRRWRGDRTAPATASSSLRTSSAPGWQYRRW